MISIKEAAKVKGLHVETLLGFLIVASVLHEHGYGATITEGSGGTHMPKSLHYEGYAVDIRSKHVKTFEEKESIMATAVKALGSDFDLILENLGLENEHWHLEFQPKD